MNVFVSCNGHQAGPFSENVILAKLRAHELTLADMAWHAGASSWQPVGALPFVRAKQDAAFVPPPMMVSGPTCHVCRVLSW
jgi:hypothetical protein